MPEEGKQITALDFYKTRLGQLLSFEGNGYFHPMNPDALYGAIYRAVGVHNTMVADKEEDFPFIRDVYVRVLDQEKVNLKVLIDSEAYTGFIDMVLAPSVGGVYQGETVLEVELKIFPRRDISATSEPNTGFVAFSTMFFKGENDIKKEDEREIHDSDYVEIEYNDGTPRYEVPLDNPSQIFIRRFEPNYNKYDAKVKSLGLQQRDRNEEHYNGKCQCCLGDYAYRASFKVTSIESDIKLIPTIAGKHAKDEWGENWVVFLAIGQDLHKANSIDDAITIKYTLTAYPYSGPSVP